MPIIHVPELVTRVTKAFGIRGAASIDTLAPEIVPTALVADLSGEAGWRLALGEWIVTAVAAQYSMIIFANPGGPTAASSRTLIHFQRVEPYHGNAQSVNLGFLRYAEVESVGIATVLGKNWRDFRETSEKPSLIVKGHNAVGGILDSKRYFMSWRPWATFVGSYPNNIDLDIYLTPGWAIAFQQTAVNLDLALNYWWRERAIFPDEEVTIARDET